MGKKNYTYYSTLYNNVGSGFNYIWVILLKIVKMLMN